MTSWSASLRSIQRVRRPFAHASGLAARALCGPHPCLYSTAQGIAPRGDPAPAHYILFVTHHLLAASKQSDIRAWCRELGLVGFAKRGYPGVILLAAAQAGPVKGQAKGNIDRKEDTHSAADWRQQEHVDRLIEVGRRIKSLRWASQDLRPLQPLSFAAFSSLWTALSQRLDLPSNLDGCIEANVHESAHLSARSISRLLFLDSMKEVSELLRAADALHLAGFGGASAATEVNSSKGAPKSHSPDSKKGPRRQRRTSSDDGAGTDSPSSQIPNTQWTQIWRSEMGPS